VQGEAGIIVPDDGYLKGAHALLKKHNALLIADEVQTGLGRTGRLITCDYDGVHPDILVLGKSLSGGTYPISAVLANDEVRTAYTKKYSSVQTHLTGKNSILMLGKCMCHISAALANDEVKVNSVCIAQCANMAGVGLG